MECKLSTLPRFRFSRAGWIPVLLSAAFPGCLAILSGGAAGAALSEAAFRDPPLAARPSALWPWLNGHVELRQITRELEEMKAKGMRGAIIWDLGAIADPEHIIPAGPAFLGPESLAAIHHAMDEAGRLGLELGLVASSSWNAGGPWITPQDAGKELRWSELRVGGPKEFSGVLPLPEKTTGHFEDVAVLAVPYRENKAMAGPEAVIRLDGHLGAEGRLTWAVPEGEWCILRFVCHNTGQKLVCPSPNSTGLIVDHLSREAADAHFTHMLEIAVTNLWNNRIVGDLRTGLDKGFTRTNLQGKFTAKSPLLPSGLIGPVTLQFPVAVTSILK